MQWKDFVVALVDSGLTQAQIAKAAGCGQNTVSDLFTGKTKEPRGSLAFALLAIGVSRGIAIGGSIQRTSDDRAAA